MSTDLASRDFTPISRPFLDGFLHPRLSGQDDSLRRGRLHVRFGVLGGAMAIVYSAFFFLLSHPIGGGITVGCGLAFLLVPWLVRKTGNLTLTGHLYGAVLVLGIAGMCAASGGPQGPFSPWLAAVPVFALLLMDKREAILWTSISLAAVWAFAFTDLSGAGFLEVYPPQAAASFRSAGQAGFATFLVLLALLFEQARIEAFNQLRLANEHLAEANDELSRLNLQKNEFLNIAAHDLKNPLTIICGYADLLRELESPTLVEIRNKASEILRSGNHMLDIIQNILEVRRIEDGRRQVSQRRCSLDSIVSDLVEDYSGAVAAKQITLNVASAPDLPEAWADPTGTRQILDNLISNAVKYSPKGGNVVIGLSHTDEHVVIDIADSGPGLSDSDQLKLWQKFQRLTPRPTAGETSNGLGLWIVRQLTESMNGTVFCHSILGRGSIFGVRLPIWNGQYEDDTPDSAESEGAMQFEEIIANLEARATKHRDAASAKKEEEETVALPN
ncbi:MAG: HAMP domain-containing histidine kinase [Verrucomicrobiae bacterium]|nr:HAMP domain-containing histidine kinase [Verrucomicrobiae bacterium]